jgi:hypothetical protein
MSLGNKRVEITVAPAQRDDAVKEHAMADKLAVGDKVSWKWGSGKAEGKVAAVHTKPVEKTIKGKRIKRNADSGKPAYEVKQPSGQRALKTGSELSKSGS